MGLLIDRSLGVCLCAYACTLAKRSFVRFVIRACGLKIKSGVLTIPFKEELLR